MGQPWWQGHKIAVRHIHEPSCQSTTGADSVERQCAIASGSQVPRHPTIHVDCRQQSAEGDVVEFGKNCSVALGICKESVPGPDIKTCG